MIEIDSSLLIEIDSSLLSQSNLDALISKIIAQQTAHDAANTQSLDAALFLNPPQSLLSQNLGGSMTLWHPK